MLNADWLSKGNDEEIRNRITAMMQSQGARPDDTDRLGTIYLFLTRKCNLGCQHCYIEGVGPQARDNDFGIDEIRRMVDQARPHGLRKVKVSGGEPLIHSDAMEVLEYLDSLGLDEIVLETNGTLFREDTSNRLAGIRNLTVFISLDHIDAHEHDAFRGKKGSYAKATNAVKELIDAKIRTVVTTTANRHNYQHLGPMIDLVLGWGGYRHRTLLNIHPLGNARDHQDNALTLEECIETIGSVVHTEAYRSGKAYVTLPPALTPLEKLDGVHTCGWGDNVLGLLSTGEVSMCSASYDDPDMIAGNAHDTPLMEIWKNSKMFKDLRAVGAGAVKGICGNCVFYSACRGVCKMSSYGHYGEKDAPYPLCQEFYNRGIFPAYAIRDPNVDSTYHPPANGKVQASAQPLLQIKRLTAPRPSATASP
jgi:radical SAM protein with 4Fe4S-binding SPASM domain